MSKIIGIDLGTGNSAMAIMESGNATIIPNAEGERTTPSIVAFTKGGERLVGQAAKRQSVTNPKNTIYAIKRFIGRKFDDVSDEIKKVPFEVVKADNGDAHIKVDDKVYSPEEISSFILAKLKKDAEAYLGETITEAVITVPAYFNDAQRQATKDAGRIAGLDVKRIINEPTAAALAYGSDKKKNGCIAVTDPGSGTYDVSILDISDGVFEVKATNGDTHLGGTDIDNVVMDWIIEDFKKESGIDLSSDSMALQRIKEAAENAKCALSTSLQHDINLPFITADATGPKHIVKTLTRAKLEALSESVLERLVSPARTCLSDSAVEKIDEVLLVGGMTRMPCVQAKIKDIFGIEPSKSVNPDEAVALGAAIQGGVLKGDVKDVLLLDVTPLTLSIETVGGIATAMVEKNTTIPVCRKNVFSTATDNQTAVTIRICQGERKMFADNKILGNFNLDGIPPAPRGVPQIEISYDIDANGILNVTAKDLGTNKEQKITITASSGLSEEEIERAKADAEAHAAEDEKRVKLINTRNMADGMCFATEKSLKDNADKISEELKKKAEDAIKSVKDTLSSDDVDKINKSTEELSKVNSEIASIIYKDVAKENPMNEEQIKNMFKNGGFDASMFNKKDTDKKPNDDVVDAEVVS